METLPVIALVVEDASLRLGPDAARGVHYFQGLRARGADVHLVTRDCHRAELCQHLAGEEERIHGVPDPAGARWVSRLQLFLPPHGRSITAFIRSLMIQRAQCKRVRELVRSSGVRIVHQVTPVRPRHPAFFRELGVPIVMGPLSESADAPPGFCEQASSPQRALDLLAHLATALLHRVFPGRLRAEALLVADAKSSRAVPGRASGRKFRLAADGVDLTKWKGRDAPPARDVPKFLFVGRLSAGCGADHLLDAFRLTLDAGPARLEIAAEGPMRGALERRAEALDLSRDVEFSGWLGGDARRHAIEQADALVYPGLRGAGTDVVMHAMASGLPVVATSWGAAAEIASDGAGLLVGPRTKRQFTNELANVMHRLAASPSLRRELGERAQVHARNEFDWNHRLDRLSDVYRQLVNDAGGQRQPDKSPRGDEASR